MANVEDDHDPLEERCVNCYYSRYHGTVLLFCHRYAPRPAVNYERTEDDWNWMPVGEDQWCGEWRKDVD